jgi:hypothetical protein
MKTVTVILTVVLIIVAFEINAAKSQATFRNFLRTKYKSIDEKVHEAAGLTTLIGPLVVEKTVNLVYRLLQHVSEFQQDSGDYRKQVTTEFLLHE